MNQLTNLLKHKLSLIDPLAADRLMEMRSIHPFQEHLCSDEEFLYYEDSHDQTEFPRGMCLRAGCAGAVSLALKNPNQETFDQVDISNETKDIALTLGLSESKEDVWRDLGRFIECKKS